MTNNPHTDRLPPGVTWVTPTRRLAHYLRARHDAACVAAGQRVWQTPDIVTWRELVRRMFEADREAGRTSCRWLEPVHARLVWEQIIQRDDRLQAVIAPAGIAAMALRAWTLQHDYLIPVAALAADSSAEVQAFAAWRAQYVQWLRRGAWRDAAEASIHVGPLSSAGGLTLVGFDELTPAQAELCDRLLAAGLTVVRDAERPAALVAPSVVNCNDFDDEIETAARWAAQRLQRSPGQRVAIVVRGLGQQRERVRRILDRVLAPAVAVAGGAAPESTAYELSAARSLVERPVVAAMLGWLSAFATATDFVACSALLRSAFDRAALAEAGARAELDAWLRRHETAELSVARLEQHAARRGCVEFASLLRLGLARAQGWSRRRLPSEWVREFAGVAQDVGWPGSNADSAAYQATQRWQVLLGEFGASDDVTGALGMAAALSHLRELARSALFEPQEIKAPLVVIDPETSAGMHFAAAWVVGLEATHWPAPAAPDPFLPRDWQVRARIPGASAELAAAAAQRTLDRLRRDTGELVLSVPAFEDEAPLLPSPLVLGFGPAAKPALWEGADVASATYAARPELERLVDGAMHAIAEHHVAQGGARLIELQAVCPFRAAVELRLGGRELEDPAPGIDSTARGNLAHAVLKAFWDDVRGQQRLAAMTRDERRQRVCALVEQQLTPLRAAASGVLMHLLDLEQLWLEARVMELLDVDLARPAFTVEHTELAASAEVGGLQLRLQLDRVDRLADDSLAVIDYKTGANAARSDWMGERPRSPQLPLYVRAVGSEEVSAVAFARVRTGATEYTGYVRDQKLFSGLQGFVPGRKPFQEHASWDDLLEAWGRRLDFIGQEFGRGDARLAPDPAHACKRCHLPGLCRIGEIDDDGAEAPDDGR